jgi:hypothetical protein
MQEMAVMFNKYEEFLPYSKKKKKTAVSHFLKLLNIKSMKAVLYHCAVKPY